MTDKERKRAYRLAHPEKVKADKARYYVKHRERLRAKFAAEYAANRDFRLKQVKQRYEKLRPLILQQKRVEYAANPGKFLAIERRCKAANYARYCERAKQYQKARRDSDPEAFREYHRNALLKRRALERQAFIEFVDARAVFTANHGICGICRTPIDPASRWHLDHVIPLSKGGVHSYDNVQIAHAHCNLAKASKLPDGQLGLFGKLCAEGGR